MVLLIDNYDSFVYNLVQYLGELGQECLVFRNDKISLEQIEKLSPTHIVISPGPCTPNEAGISLELVKHFAGKIPILGVCLGHQVIGQAFGAKVVRAPKPVHGKTSLIYHSAKGVLNGIPSPFEATRYHSLIISEKNLPAELEVTAWTDDQIIMGIRHRKFEVEGVQFHPESILTQHGHKLLDNFVSAERRKGCDKFPGN